MSVNLQKKLSIAKVCGKVTGARIVKEGSNGVLKLARFFGSATGKKQGVSDFGEWLALTGQFRAVNIATGETFDSAVCFLPDVALDLVLAQLAANVQAVDFAFEISAVEDSTVAVGYTYRASPLLEMESESPVMRLEKKLAALALPEPVAEPEKAGKKK